MNTNSAVRLDAVEQALCANPLQTGLVFERMLLLLERQDFANATDMFSKVRSSNISGSAERRLKKLLSGECAVTRHEGFYFVGNVSEHQRNACVRARDLLQENGLKLEKVLLIEFGAVPLQFAATLPIDANTAYLCIAGVNDVELEAAAVHEFCHVALSSGNLFLDEGAAYYFELVSQQLFPAGALERIQSQRALPPIDLRTLLAYEAKDDAYFILILPNNKLRVHASGALLFEDLLQRLGMAQVAQIYAQIKDDGIEADAAAIIEYAIGTVIEEMAADSHIWPDSTQAVITEDDIDIVHVAYIKGDTEKLLEYYHDIFRTGRAAPGKDGRLAEAELLILAVGAVERGFEREISRFESAYVRAQLLQFLATQNKGSRYYLFRALMSIARAPCEGSILDGTLLFDEAKTDLEIALARDANDPLVLTCLARIEWSFPQDGCAGKQRAITLLKRIAALPAYGKYIESTLQKCLFQFESSES